MDKMLNQLEANIKKFRNLLADPSNSEPYRVGVANLIADMQRLISELKAKALKAGKK